MRTKAKNPHPGMPMTPVEKTIVVNPNATKKTRRHLRRVKGGKALPPPYVASEDTSGSAGSSPNGNF